MGAALTVLCPLAWRLITGRNEKLPDQIVLPIWAAAVVTTATGRVLSDCHWITDTMGGACVGVGCVSALAMVVSRVQSWVLGSREEADRREQHR